MEDGNGVFSLLKLKDGFPARVRGKGYGVASHPRREERDGKKISIFAKDKEDVRVFTSFGQRPGNDHGVVEQVTNGPGAGLSERNLTRAVFGMKKMFKVA
jgi:hypothetical protein